MENLDNKKIKSKQILININKQFSEKNKNNVSKMDFQYIRILDNSKNKKLPNI